MNDIDERQDHLIRLLAPNHRIPPSAAQPTGGAAEDLLHQILRLSESDREPVGTVRRRPSWFSRRRLFIAIPTAAALAALVFVLSAVLPSNGPGGPAPAHALQITQTDGYIDIRILDPVADPQRYRAELAEHGLDIELTLAPAAPEQVGRIIFQETGDTGTGPKIQLIEAPGDCTANGNCSVGIRVPKDYRSYARVVFGRTPMPGESVEGDAPVLTPQQHQQMRALVGKRVSEVRALLASRGQTAQYRAGADSHSVEADQVPGEWFVNDVAPLAGGVMVLWVAPTRE